MSFSYSEVKEYKLIDAEVLECIPSTCDGEFGCGSELQFTENLVQVHCDNPYCTYKIAARLEAMAKMMQADGWGESTCQKVVKHFDLKSPCMVFLLGNGKYYCPDVSAFDKKVASICDLEKRKIPLWKVAKYMNLPGISDKARKIFDGYGSFEEAYNNFEDNIFVIIEKLGLKKDESSICAVNTHNTLIQYKAELLAAEKHFEVIREKGDKITIVITGGVRGFKNKQEFVNHLNLILNGKATITMLGGVNSDLDILVADQDTSSSKYKKATAHNNKATAKGDKLIQILDGSGCESYLRNRYGL